MTIIINGSTGITGPLSDGDTTINGLNVGLGGGSIATNTAVGYQSLNGTNTVGNQTAVGYQALYSNTSGADNTAVGHVALYSNTSGSLNTAFGRQALYSNVSGSSNAAFGMNALVYNTGSYNTAVGQAALLNNTSAANNTAVGYQALYSNTIGTSNTAIGVLAGYTNQTGNNNTYVGYQSGDGIGSTSHSDNTAVGYKTFWNISTGSANTGMGSSAFYNLTTGSNNVAMGQGALYYNTTSSNNTAVGQGAGYYTTGANNSFFGNGAGGQITSGAKNTILGGYNGNQNGLDIRTSSNYIVLSDGDGNIRGYFDNSGNLEIGGTFAQGRKLGVDSATNGYTMQLLQTSAYSSGYLAGTVYSGYYDGSNITDMASIRGGKENTTISNYGGMLAFYTRSNGGSDTERARIDSSGNLGVGTTSPSAYGGFVSQYAGIGLHTNSTSGAAGLNFYEGGTGRFSLRTLNGSAGLSFYDSYNGTERARIDSSGNFMVGTTSSQTKFTVGGFGSSVNTQWNGIAITTPSAYSGVTGNIGLYLYASNSGGSLNAFFRTKAGAGGAYDGAEIATAGRPFRILTSTTEDTSEVMRIDTSGNLGLGLIPSSWNTVTPVFQIGGGASLYGYGNEVRLNSNYYYNSGDKYLSNGYAASYNQASGVHKWFTAGNNSSGAGAALSFNQAMTLDNTGNLLLGATSIGSYGSKFLIQGSTGTYQGLSIDGQASIVSFYTSGTSDGAIGQANYVVSGAASSGAIGIGSQGVLYFASGGTTERARIDTSGNFLVGTTADSYQPSKGVAINASNSSRIGVGHASGTASGDYYCSFAYNGGVIGSITQNGTTAVAFNTTSDQRLKNDLGVVKSTNVIADTIVHDFTWKSDGSQSRGVFAQEAAKVLPAAVVVGDDGEEVTDTWAVDYSKYVPDLIVYCQQLSSQVTELQALSLIHI